MVPLFIKYKLKLKLGIYMYIYFIYKIYMVLSLVKFFFLDLFIFIISINIYFIFYLFEFNILHRIIKFYVNILLLLNNFVFYFSYIILNHLHFINKNLLNYFFNYLNSLKDNLKYILIKEILYFIYKEYNNNRLYKYYIIMLFEELKPKPRLYIHFLLVRLDQQLYVIVMRIIFKFYNIYKVLLINYNKLILFISVKLNISTIIFKLKRKLKVIYLYMLHYYNRYMFIKRFFIYHIYKYVLINYLKKKIWYFFFFLLTIILEIFFYLLKRFNNSICLLYKENKLKKNKKDVV